MTFFEMFDSDIISICNLLSNLGKRSYSTSRIIMSICQYVNIMSSTPAEDCCETLYKEMYLMSKFCDFRKGDLLDCQSHRTT